MKRFEVSEMASGGLALVLEPSASWRQFRRYAKEWSARIGAVPISEPCVTENECLWEVTLEGGEFWITYDDWQQAIHLEPKDKADNSTIVRLQGKLQGYAT